MFITYIFDQDLSFLKISALYLNLVVKYIDKTKYINFHNRFVHMFTWIVNQYMTKYLENFLLC
jgi:hypothetical protein